MLNRRVRLMAVKRRAQRDAKTMLEERTNLMEGLKFLNMIRNGGHI